MVIESFVTTEFSTPVIPSMSLTFWTLLGLPSVNWDLGPVPLLRILLLHCFLSVPIGPASVWPETT